MDSDESLEIGVPYSQTNSFQENLSKDMNRNLLMSSTKTNQPYWYVSDWSSSMYKKIQKKKLYTQFITTQFITNCLDMWQPYRA